MAGNKETSQAVYQLMIENNVKENNAQRISNAICGYLEFRKLGGETFTPETLLAEAQTDLKKCKLGLDKYFSWLKGERTEGYPTNEKPLLESSAYQNVYSKSASFFSHQGIAFGKGFTPKISKINKALGADKDHEFLKVDETGLDTVIDKTELKTFLNALSPRDRAVGLAMLSSSQDSGDIFGTMQNGQLKSGITIGEFKKGCKMNHTGIRFFWEGQRVKTNEVFKTFFSVEATEAVSNYIKSERIGAEDSEPLFLANGKNGKMVRMETEHLNKSFLYCAKNIGIKWDNEKHLNPFRPKRLRHFWETCAYKAKVDLLLTKNFMGHAQTETEGYIENRADLEIIYSRIEPKLSIFTGSEQLEQAVKSVANAEDTLAQYKKEVAELRLERLEARARIDTIEKANESLAKKFNLLEGALNSILEGKIEIKNLKTPKLEYNAKAKVYYGPNVEQREKERVNKKV